MTLVELLIVLAVISLLVGLLIPAVTAVKNSAMEAKQKGQRLAIDVALTTFNSDYGHYPPSDLTFLAGAGTGYCGAQKLCEALLGWDLLGFHPKSEFRADGFIGPAPGVFIYNAADPVLMGERMKPYLELGTQTAFKLGDLFARTGTGSLAPDTYVLCDVFGKTKVTLPDGKAVNAGAPILYYRADSGGRVINEVYKVMDNDAVVLAKSTADGRAHPLSDITAGYKVFYDYITDPKITAKQWPYRPGSYILISAGADGIYGTPDDIRNFGD
jgi:type II secretory pathway pseudopilin PulG